ncbi:MAG: right-handed parallel beta-helix repeat-containing protein [Nonlabens sp.]|uniref:right-handed parallel beta-helix repeat-containing protein n=1 Tax=Nonlabens sp. TaxID=1888209 RepID=UPI003EF178B5
MTLTAYRILLKSKKTALLLFLLLFCGMYIHAQEIHVAPTGNDGNEGTLSKPVATIEQAAKLVNDLKRSSQTRDTVRVLLHKGTYRLKTGVILNKKNSGTAISPIVYQNYQNDKVIISGAIELTNYDQLSPQHELFQQDPVIGDKIIKFDLTKTDITEFKEIQLSGFRGEEELIPFTLQELFFNGKSMQLSRWPNNSFTEFSDVVKKSINNEERIGIVYKNDHISRWTNEPNILLHGYWKYLWADAYESVESIDPINKTIWLKPPYNHYNFSKNMPFAAYNVISEIDEPGEWAYDYISKNIYFYPLENVIDASLELSVCKTPLLSIQNASYITFKGIQFQHTAGHGIALENCHQVQIINSTIKGCAGDGILMNGGSHNLISSCTIEDMGRGGIRVSGGDRVTLEKAHFVIENCHIHHLARIDHTYTPGIWVDGVGTEIRNCKIHDVASSAMRINGNDHLIEYNEMYNVVTESDDQGAIDMWGDPTYRGNIFRYNYIHDIGPYNQDKIDSKHGRAGIRFDDAISGNQVYSNVFKNASHGTFGAIQIHGGKDNDIYNNLFRECEIGISFTPWTYDKWMYYNKKTLEFFEQNKSLYISQYPNLQRMNDDMNKNTIENNIFIRSKKVTKNKPREVIFEDNIKIRRRIRKMKVARIASSPNEIGKVRRNIAFEPIPFEQIGLIEK